MKKKKKYKFQYYSILGACCHCWTILISTEFCEGPIEQIYLVEEIHSWKKKKKKNHFRFESHARAAAKQKLVGKMYYYI